MSSEPATRFGLSWLDCGPVESELAAIRRFRAAEERCSDVSCPCVGADQDAAIGVGRIVLAIVRPLAQGVAYPFIFVTLGKKGLRDER